MVLKNGSDISVFEIIILAVGVPISLFQVFWGWYTVSIRDKDEFLWRVSECFRDNVIRRCVRSCNFTHFKKGQKIECGGAIGTQTRILAITISYILYITKSYVTQRQMCFYHTNAKPKASEQSLISPQVTRELKSGVPIFIIVALCEPAYVIYKLVMVRLLFLIRKTSMWRVPLATESNQIKTLPELKWKKTNRIWKERKLFKAFWKFAKDSYLNCICRYT